MGKIFVNNNKLGYLDVFPLWFRGREGQLLEILEWNTDGQRADPDRPPAVLHQQAGPVHAAAQPALATVYKIDAIVLNVKADEVTAEDALEEEVAPGEYLHHVPAREGDVEEEAELAGEPLLLRHLAVTSKTKQFNLNNFLY